MINPIFQQIENQGKKINSPHPTICRTPRFSLSTGQLRKTQQSHTHILFLIFNFSVQNTLSIQNEIISDNFPNQNPKEKHSHSTTLSQINYAQVTEKNKGPKWAQRKSKDLSHCICIYLRKQQIKNPEENSKQHFHVYVAGIGNRLLVPAVVQLAEIVVRSHHHPVACFSIYLYLSPSPRIFREPQQLVGCLFRQ